MAAVALGRAKRRCLDQEGDEKPPRNWLVRRISKASVVRAYGDQHDGWGGSPLALPRGYSELTSGALSLPALQSRGHPFASRSAHPAPFASLAPNTRAPGEGRTFQARLTQPLVTHGLCPPGSSTKPCYSRQRIKGCCEPQILLLSLPGAGALVCILGA